jgi:hypothetical protein
MAATVHAGRIGRDHCLAPERVDAPIYGGRYRALFPELPAPEVDETALHALGRPGGPCDLGIDFPDDADARPTERATTAASAEARTVGTRCCRRTR